MKKSRLMISSVLCSLLILFSFNVIADSNVGVSPINPSENRGDIIIPFDLDVPEDVREAPYSFSGEASNSMLYTNYLITGDTDYILEVKNRSDSNSLNVRVYRVRVGPDEVLASRTISPGAISISGVSTYQSTDEIYIAFSPPSDFSGEIR